ncbi:carbohydrate-binding protein [Anabaena azotica]|uniref:Carbohydrate-binding protein n=1 Tax=Anabaena azotica FACHB-119 TaxID=947527 RepID=A0ABR8D5C3_9NOST|nr:carbohydrate-binding protein [Anabaena azotica]MBD2501500.1 carbohydrate-binding protein [Anabaena azotica FACHB-119]
MTKLKYIKFFLLAAMTLILSVSGVTYAQTSGTTTIPVSAVAPWPVFQRIDALTFSSRVGLSTVWGDYWERSEEPNDISYVGNTQELTNTANGNYAVYNSINLGSGVEALMLRIALASGTNTVEVRLNSSSGTLVGTCTINSTGSVTTYRTVPCPVDSNLAKGIQNLVIRFTGTNSQMRFNWFAFWAKDTTQKIDDIQKKSDNEAINKPAPVSKISGTSVRTKSMLPASSETLAKSYGLWSPGKTWECPKWIHDTYWVKGEDGKVYPTWHPPVDFNPETNSYCTYGHDHGDDPRGSEAFSIGGMPAFGYVNEQQAVNDPANPRHEDHFGHKVLVANNWTMYNANNSSLTTKCDVVIKLHMGTHSPDALTNTAHEILLSGKCDGQQAFNLKRFALFGTPGSFKEAEESQCNLPVTSGILPTPSNQPTGNVHRAIPTSDCYRRGTTAQQVSAVATRTREFWLTSLVGGDFYFTITNPARFYDPSSATKIGRTVDNCYIQGHPLYNTLLCQETRGAGSKVSWDDPRSPFRGTVQSSSHFSALSFDNSQSSVVYTDAYGRNARTSPTPGGINLKQIVPTQGFSFKVDGQASIFATTDYSASGTNGVRAPN